MKTLPLLTFVAAVATFLAVPIRFEIGAGVVFAFGFLAVALTDYARAHRPLPVGSSGVHAVAARREKFGLAA